MPAAETSCRVRPSPASGSGTSTTVRTSGPPNSVICTARMQRTLRNAGPDGDAPPPPHPRRRVLPARPTYPARVTAETTTLADGLGFPEGPRWHGGRLWFSDFHDRRVRTLTPDGDLTTVLDLDDSPSGLGWTPD